jgi:virulence-associated protein VagC
MEMAKLFMNGKSQAVQSTMKFRFRGNKVLIKKIGDAVILLPYETADFDASSALTYGRVRVELEAKDTPICVLNTLNTEHALTLKVSLMTNNPCEFQRVNGLTVENWL